MLLLGRCVLLSALAWGQQHSPRSGPKARRSKGRRGARRLEDVPTAVPTSHPTPTFQPTSNPTLVPTPVPTALPTAVPMSEMQCASKPRFTSVLSPNDPSP